MWRVWSLVSVSIATYFTLPVLFCNPDIRKITQELLLVKRQPATAARCPAEETQTLPSHPGYRATNPLNRDTDWSSIHDVSFVCVCVCARMVFLDSDIPQLATRLLAHKIQSPQEWEAMQALLVLETCMKNCGKRFHSEVGKFRLLFVYLCTCMLNMSVNHSVTVSIINPVPGLTVTGAGKKEGFRVDL
uniref:VHS domain-containing protein n=1 Tax=Sphaeramia orbicularis TaxID=375764 RepID=A0A672ZUQ2_9TELE